MKKTLSIIITFILCVSLCACGFDQKTYDTYLAGKSFESDGRILSFDDNNRMTYNYTNMVGDTFYYEYSVTEITEDGDKITMTLEQDYANNDRENTDDGEVIEAVYSISDNSMEYYSNTYEYIA